MNNFKLINQKDSLEPSLINNDYAIKRVAESPLAKLLEKENAPDQYENRNR